MGCSRSKFGDSLIQPFASLTKNRPFIFKLFHIDHLLDECYDLLTQLDLVDAKCETFLSLYGVKLYLSDLLVLREAVNLVESAWISSNTASL